MNHQQSPKNNSVMTRHLALADRQAGNQADQLVQVLEQSKGVVAAQLKGNGKLTLQYDVSLTELDTLLALCQQLGCSIKQSRWQQFRLGWFRFVDQNVRDNANHQPACCNKAPR